MKQRIKAILAYLIAYSPLFPVIWGMTAYYNLQRLRGFPIVKRRFRRKAGYELDLDNPTSLNQKLTHRKLFCRDPIWIEVTDKVAVRDWLRRNNLLGEDLRLIPALGVFRTARQLHKAKLPQRCIIKAAWASGRNAIIEKGVDQTPSLGDDIQRWMLESPTYRYQSLIWPAWHIPRRLVVEEFLADEDGNPPRDIKFFVFHGRVRFFYILSDRLQGRKTKFYNRNLDVLDVRSVSPTSPDSRLPENIDRVIAAAEAIGRFFDFARVDLYSHNGAVYFGEITQTPNNGEAAFHPEAFDFEAGTYWDYPRGQPGIEPAAASGAAS